MFQRVLLDFVLKTFGLGAENETRTRDPNLGKVVLYQLSYFRSGKTSAPRGNSVLRVQIYSLFYLWQIFSALFLKKYIPQNATTS